jgi:hypothetical protein
MLACHQTAPAQARAPAGRPIAIDAVSCDLLAPTLFSLASSITDFGNSKTVSLTVTSLFGPNKLDFVRAC